MNTRFRHSALGGALAFASVGAVLSIGAMAVPAGAALDAVRVDQSKGLTTEGEAVFDCVLEPFDSAFRYEGAFVARAVADDESGHHVLKLAVPPMPGIAPVAIENGRMEATVEATYAGEPVVFESETVVNVAALAPVEMPEAVTVALPNVGEGELSLERFTFAFDELMGLVITADCGAVGGANLGSLAGGGSSDGAVPVEVDASVESAEAGGSTLVPVGIVALVAAALAGGAVVLLRRRRATE